VPSWRIHRAVYERFRREIPGLIVRTPGLLERIDEIIDQAYGEHDLGVKPDPLSFNRLLRALWLEFGDIYDVQAGRFLNTSSEERARFEQELLVNPFLEERYLLEIPDDALMIATLHHLLDAATYCLLNSYPPITADRSELMIDCAVQAISPYLYRLEQLKTTWGTPYSQVLGYLITALKERSQWLYVVLYKYIRSKGLEPGRGALKKAERIREMEEIAMLTRTLSEACRKVNTKCLFYVNGHLLPGAAAIRKAYSIWKRGRTVRMVSLDSKIRVSASNPKEFLEQINRLLKD